MRALRCLGYVLFGIGGAALCWVSDATAHWFDLPSKYGVLFLLGYLVLLAGGFVGGVLCKEDRA